MRRWEERREPIRSLQRGNQVSKSPLTFRREPNIHRLLRGCGSTVLILGSNVSSANRWHIRWSKGTETWLIGWGGVRTQWDGWHDYSLRTCFAKTMNVINAEQSRAKTRYTVIRAVCKVLVRGWRKGSEVKSAYCSWRRSKFSFQHLNRTAHNYPWHQLQRTWCCLLAFVDTHIHVNTYIP